MKKLTSLVLATGMVLSLAACGGSGSSTAASTNTDGSTATTDTAAADESNLGYEYGEHFHSDEPVTYTMFFNDNPAYPMNDKWINEGVFKAIEEATNVHLELTVVDNSNYTDKVSLAVSSGTSPYIIPKIYTETAYVTGGGVVPVSDYVQYMPNYSNFVEEYNMQDDLATITQAYARGNKDRREPLGQGDEGNGLAAQLGDEVVDGTAGGQNLANHARNDDHRDEVGQVGDRLHNLLEVNVLDLVQQQGEDQRQREADDQILEVQQQCVLERTPEVLILHELVEVLQAAPFIAEDATGNGTQ